MENDAMNKILRAVCFAVIALTLAAGVLSCVLMFVGFDVDIMMFKADSGAIFGAYCALCGALCIAEIALVIFFKKKGAVLSVDTAENESMAVRALRYAGGAVFALGSVMWLIDSLNGSSAKNSGLAVFGSLLLVCFSLYFFPEVGKKLNMPALSSACGLLGAVGYLLKVLAVYVDMSIPIASEYRVFTAVGFVFLLLFLVSELRMKLSYPKPFWYLTMLLLSCSVCGSLYIGRTVFYIFGAPSFSELSASLCGFGFYLYILGKIFCIAFAPNCSKYSDLEEDDVKNG